ncbi:MAG: ATP-binding cassette domain-containing protein [Spirochaetales bacterium]|nr:ATP-binding cassette domain-containing protein [Spirochaetales bacterium]
MNMTPDVSVEEAIAALTGEPLVSRDDRGVEAVTILSGHDKSGAAETYKELTISSGEVVCIVGSTGSGKSRLLADIEWLAQGDTPTGRSIRINGEIPDLSRRYAGGGRLVAQLSQNMNFVMDATVREFLELHGESRGIGVDESTVARVVEAANRLTGEPIDAERQLTELSGGQSRSLMIADTALLSVSPIVLIDEIENAGINRHEAIAVLSGADKIVLVATHDPSLALSASRRVVLSRGGITGVHRRSDREMEVARKLHHLDRLHEELRSAIRTGAHLDDFVDDGRLPE